MSDEKQTCFVIMPITTPESCYEQYEGDKDHFEHVQNHLFKPAIEKAGFEAILPKSTGSENIQAEIIEKLTTSDMVLCDMSILNANVFFEFGVRTSLNRPVTLVVDDKTPKIPFDVGTINRETYKSALNGWEIEADIEMIANHIKESSHKAHGQNALWKRFKIQETAEFSTDDVTPEDKLNLILNEIESLKESNGIRPTGIIKPKKRKREGEKPTLSRLELLFMRKIIDEVFHDLLESKDVERFGSINEVLNKIGSKILDKYGDSLSEDECFCLSSEIHSYLSDAGLS